MFGDTWNYGVELNMIKWPWIKKVLIWASLHCYCDLCANHGYIMLNDHFGFNYGDWDVHLNGS